MAILGKDAWEDVGEEGPEFVQIVLEGRAGEEEAEGDGQAGERGAEGGLLVLEAVALVDCDGVKEEALCEEGLLGSQRVVCRVRGVGTQGGVVGGGRSAVCAAGLMARRVRGGGMGGQRRGKCEAGGERCRTAAQAEGRRVWSEGKAASAERTSRIWYGGTGVVGEGSSGRRPRLAYTS